MLILLIKNVDQELNSKLCTLFPDRVLPAMSSLLINNENSFGRLGRLLEYHAEQATKQKYLKFLQNHLKENRLKLYMFRSTIDLSLLT